MAIITSCCHNPSLGLTTKARACEDAGQKWSAWITFHAPESVGKCEGMNEFLENDCRDQTHWIEKFVISLESFLNVNV
jgi:hypothetical protein